MLRRRHCVDGGYLRPLRRRLHLEVIAALHIGPKFRRRAEDLGETQRGIGGDGAFVLHDAFDARAVHAEVSRQGSS